MLFPYSQTIDKLRSILAWGKSSHHDYVLPSFQPGFFVASNQLWCFEKHFWMGLSFRRKLARMYRRRAQCLTSHKFQPALASTSLLWYFYSLLRPLPRTGGAASRPNPYSQTLQASVLIHTYEEIYFFVTSSTSFSNYLLTDIRRKNSLSTWISIEQSRHIGWAMDSNDGVKTRVFH